MINRPYNFWTKTVNIDCLPVYTIYVETDAKKSELVQNKVNNTNPQFLSNQADVQATLTTHELIILSKFLKDWKGIVVF